MKIIFDTIRQATATPITIQKYAISSGSRKKNGLLLNNCDGRQPITANTVIAPTQNFQPKSTSAFSSSSETAVIIAKISIGI